MRIIFVRHGEPDYENDCLTSTGREQAAACAARLAGYKLGRNYKHLGMGLILKLTNDRDYWRRCRRS